ncbi:tryptophan-rich sensory protein [Belnapia sp. T6]|uniref:Tryptophan-rich sensory protein n=1 Tax=Belnapia mucosa TaxID=2804532 RepID=A0ABS1V9D2_9PROT|nr:TspO/MBR family protein [Belnapia mucosa]MBL6458282.1 tryptophan-rich sensory protein [Belnapia mucosa]
MDGSLMRAAVPQGGNAGGLGLGLVLTGGAVLASALVSARYSPSPAHGRIRRDYNRLEKPPFNPPDSAFAIWGPLYALLTLSGLRLWNAPRGPGRDRALLHWFGAQGLNALWLWLGFARRRRGVATLEATATVVNAAALVDAARRVDPPAAWMALPYAGWIGFAALLSEELWRRNRGRVSP